MDIDVLNSTETDERNREAEGFAAVMYLIRALHCVVPEEYILFIENFMKSKHKDYFKNVKIATDYLDLCDPVDRNFLSNLKKNYNDLKDNMNLADYKAFRLLDNLLSQEMESRESISPPKKKNGEDYSVLYDQHKQEDKIVQPQKPIEILVDSTGNRMYLKENSGRLIEIADTSSLIDNSSVTIVPDLSSKILTVNPYTGDLDDLPQRLSNTKMTSPGYYYIDKCIPNDYIYGFEEDLERIC